VLAVRSGSSRSVKAAAACPARTLVDRIPPDALKPIESFSSTMGGRGARSRDRWRLGWACDPRPARRVRACNQPCPTWGRAEIVDDGPAVSADDSSSQWLSFRYAGCEQRSPTVAPTRSRVRIVPCRDPDGVSPGCHCEPRDRSAMERVSPCELPTNRRLRSIS